MVDYIKTLPKKGTKDIENDLKKICEAAGVKTIISISFTGLSYLVEDIASHLYLKEYPINQETRIILKVLKVCGNSRDTMFYWFDRFNGTNDIKLKIEYSKAHYKEMVNIAQQLDEILGSPPNEFLLLENKSMIRKQLEVATTV